MNDQVKVSDDRPVVSSALRRVAGSVLAAAGRTLDAVDRIVARSALRLPKGASFYYAFFSRAFDREHHAVLHGQNRYNEREVRSADGRYLLRRNVHRIEKGLLMKPRREVFGAEYIAETVNAYEGVVSNADARDNDQNDIQIEWARDVLTTYFDAVGSHPEIDASKRRFLALSNAVDHAPLVRVPYRRNLSEPPPVAYDQMAALSRRRRSVRWYLREPVSRSQLDLAVAIAAESPSACNRQPFRFRIFDDPEQVRKVAELPLGTPGYRDNIPVIVAVIGQLDAFFDERDRHLIYVDGGLATMSFIYALETLGLASCCINWPDVPHLEREMATLLDLAPHERLMMLVAVGHPDPEGLVAYSAKMSVDELREYNGK